MSRAVAGAVFDSQTWIAHVLDARWSQIPRTDILFDWRSYTAAFPGVPALAIYYCEVPLDIYRDTPDEARATYVDLDCHGRTSLNPDFDADVAVPCYIESFRIAVPIAGEPDKLLELRAGNALYNLDAEIVNVRKRRESEEIVATHFMPLSEDFLRDSGRWPVISDRPPSVPRSSYDA